MAHKKAQWSTKNGRDSNAKRLWIKVYWGQSVKAGNIIVRQRGNKFWPWIWVGQWNDYTIFATTNWKVQFQEKRRRKFDGNIYRDIYINVVS